MERIAFRMRKLVRSFSVVVLLLLCTISSVYADCMEIKAVSVNMPQIVVYAQEPENFDQKMVKVFLNDRSLNIENIEKVSKYKKGIRYYFLLDTSASIDDKYFQGMKNGLIAFADNLPKKDRVTVITFGEKIEEIYDSDAENSSLRKKVTGLKNVDGQTHMYEALVKLAAMADADTEQRKVAILLSDGQNVARLSNTSNEAQKKLINTGISLYPLLCDDVKTSNENIIGELARSLGGQGYLINEKNVGTRLNAVKRQVSKELVIETSADTNIIPEPFVVTLDFAKKGFIASKQRLSPVCYQRDKTAPKIEGLERVGDCQIQVYFSEPVLGAEKKENYRIYSHGKLIELQSASYSEREDSAVLKAKKPVVGGEYSITSVSIADCSMEKNALEDYKGRIAGMPYAVYTAYSFLQKYWRLVFGAALVIGMLLIATLIKRRKAFVQVDGKLVCRANVDKRYKFYLNKKPQKDNKRMVSMQIDYDGNKGTMVDYLVEQSVIFGRAETCEFRFEDPAMSRQHFYIEISGRELIVADLGTSNGTMVNGVKIKAPRRLESGDRITAGRTNITIRWRQP